jgi:UDP-N-acetyl-D-glucosamine dehydrogenase
MALTAETLKQVDCVIIVTDHTAIDYKLIARHARAVVDTRHVLPKAGPRA